MLAQIEKLQAEYGLKLQDALGSSNAARETLAAQADSSRASLKKASELFEEQVVMADTLDAPWQGFYDQVSGLMDQTYQLNEATLKFLGTQLQQRLEQNRTHMVLQAVALSVVFVLIFYLYGAFLRLDPHHAQAPGRGDGQGGGRRHDRDLQRPQPR